MEHELIGVIIKLIGCFGLWYVGARMIYQNEMDRPRHDRLGGRSVIQFLAILWPIWICGFLATGLVYLGVQLGRTVHRLFRYFTTLKSSA